MRVTSLIENSRLETADELTAEFGLSMLIEHGGSTVLFDMGSSSAFADNAARLAIDVAEVDAAVVSHQHFDHGGGLARFLEANTRAKVYLREAPLAGRHFRAFAVLDRAIGLDLEVVEQNQDRFEFVGGTHEIAPQVFLVTAIGSAHQRPRGNRKLYVRRDTGFAHDPFDHELLMLVREDDGMAVFTGCSHSGVLNLMDAAIEAFPETPIKAVFGGFHLIGLPFYDSMAASRREVEALGREILERVSGPVFTGHCTGKKAFPILKGVMGDRLQEFPTGARAEV
jgi:7,8-dihydropterin-6-yl-methyl-4-(beta-D-ribofuranosyl)aminobenzene 5'-phosphate synthase